MFVPGSRYERVPTAVHVDRDGKQRPYLLLRTFPPPAPTLGWHEFAERERLDLVAWRLLGDPEQFWRLCDANPVLHPADLTATPGDVIRITLPEGVPPPVDD
jgi:hypothetical protein